MNMEEVARRLSELRRGTGMTDAKLAAETRLMALVGAETPSELREAVIQTTELLLNQTQAACLRAAFDPALSESLDGRCIKYGETVHRSGETVKKYSALAIKDLAAALYSLYSKDDTEAESVDDGVKTDRERIADLENTVTVLVKSHIKNCRVLQDQIKVNADLAVNSRKAIDATIEILGVVYSQWEMLHGTEKAHSDKVLAFFDGLLSKLNSLDLIGKDNLGKRYSDIDDMQLDVNKNTSQSFRDLVEAFGESGTSNSLRIRTELARRRVETTDADENAVDLPTSNFSGFRKLEDLFDGFLDGL